MSDPAVDRLVADLEATADRLRSGALDADAASAAVERCAELARALGGELDRAGREAERTPAAGQEELL